ncbi:MAG: hypothetical protein AAGG48_27450 [Planctomycetota bacterium]
MNDTQPKQRTRRRFQFGIRAILLTMIVLGPISGWYGPVVVSRVLDHFAEDPTPDDNARKRAITYWKFRSIVREMEASAKARQLRRDTELPPPIPIELRGPMVNSDGTFNMLFHDSTSIDTVIVGEDDI